MNAELLNFGGMGLGHLDDRLLKGPPLRCADGLALEEGSYTFGDRLSDLDRLLCDRRTRGVCVLDDGGFAEPNRELLDRLSGLPQGRKGLSPPP